VFIKEVDAPLFAPLAGESQKRPRVDGHVEDTGHGVRPAFVPAAHAVIVLGHEQGGDVVGTHDTRADEGIDFREAPVPFPVGLADPGAVEDGDAEPALGQHGSQQKGESATGHRYVIVGCRVRIGRREGIGPRGGHVHPNGVEVLQTLAKILSSGLSDAVPRSVEVDHDACSCSRPRGRTEAFTRKAVCSRGS
jgi:hypothetical protein